MHTRLSAGTTKNSLNLDYSQALRDHILRPMVKEGGEALQFPARGMDVLLAHVCHNGYDVRATYEAQLASNLFNKLPFRYSIRSDH